MANTRVVTGFCAIALLLSSFVGTADSGQCGDLVGRWPYGPTNAMAVKNDILYWGSGTVLKITDISTPQYPNDLGELVLDSVVMDLSTFADTVYVGTFRQGFGIVDVSDPAGPQLEGWFAGSGEADDLLVSGNLVFFADGSEGLKIVDVSDPTSPTEIGSFAPASGGRFRDLALQGNLLFLAETTNGPPYGAVRVLDISNPASPTQIGYTTWDDTILSISIDGDLLCATDTFSINVVDVSDPTQPTLVGQTWFGGGVPQGIHLSDGIAYVVVSGGSYDFAVVDISDPTSPEVLSTVETPGYGRALAAAPPMAFITAGPRVEIIDVENIDTPRIAGTLDGEGSAWGLGFQEDRLFTTFSTNSTSTFLTLDVSDPTAPRGLGKTRGSSSSWARSVTVSGRFAYATLGGDIAVFDLTLRAPHQEIAVVETPGSAMSTLIDGNLLYVADNFEGVRIYDVSNPWEPDLLSVVWDPNTAARKLALVDNILVVANGGYWLKTIDVTDPGHPTILYSGHYVDQYWILDVVINDGYAYTTRLGGVLSVIDLSDPEYPTWVGSYRFAYDLSSPSVDVENGYAYVTSLDAFVILDVHDPEEISEVRRFPVPFSRDVLVADDHVYVTYGSAGIRVYETCKPPLRTPSLR